MSRFISALPLRARRFVRFITDAESWEESEHPRKSDGKFAPKGQGEAGGSSEESRSAWKQKNDAKREKVLSGDATKQAYFLYKSGFLSYDDAVDVMENGDPSEKVQQYFDIMEKNGDPTPTKPVRVAPSLFREIEVEGKWKTAGNSAYHDAKISYIKDWTGMDDQEAEKALEQFDVWFGGSWSHADTDVLDDYIDRDGVYAGEIYRGLNLSDIEYEEFLQNSNPGDTIRMLGMNSSWTNDWETARIFSGTSSHSNHIVLKCVKNKTSAPVDHISTKGESEIIAHSRAQWTVLRQERYGNNTIITVVEAEERMSEEERDKRRMQHDSAPNNEPMSIAERMEQQSAYFVAVPDPELREKLKSREKKKDE